MLPTMLKLKRSGLVLLNMLLMPLWQNKMVQNLSVSSVRRIEKEMRLTKRLKKDHLLKTGSLMPRKENGQKERQSKMKSYNFQVLVYFGRKCIETKKYNFNMHVLLMHMFLALINSMLSYVDCRLKIHRPYQSRLRSVWSFSSFI